MVRKLHAHLNKGSLSQGHQHAFTISDNWLGQVPVIRAEVVSDAETPSGEVDVEGLFVPER
jgi:hypothetical protein